MAITRTETVVYGVTDIELCTRFFADLGLEPLEAAGPGASFRTAVNQRIEVRDHSDPGLPPALEPGATLREVIWGVDSAQALSAIAADLAGDRDVHESADGVLHTVDDCGYPIGFTVEAPVDGTPQDLRRANVLGTVNRWNEELTGYGRARPLRLCHVAMNIPKQGREQAEAFYTDRLRFRAVDRVLPMGTFMQCEGDWDQHNFLLCHRPDAHGVNHIALEVRDFDEVVEGGNYMVARGWKEARVLGRHTVGSNVFRFFHAPCGGRVEYAADMSRVDESYETPRVWETSPPHHVWILKSNWKEQS